MPDAGKPKRARAPAIHIAPNDPIIPYLKIADGPFDILKLDFDSPAVRAIRESGGRLVVPLRSEGELIGLLVRELDLVLLLPSLHSQHLTAGDEEVRPPAP